MGATVDTLFLTFLGRHASAAEQGQYVGLDILEAVDKLTDSAAGQHIDFLARLYQGALRRGPDVLDPNSDYSSGGPSGWVANMNALNNGTSTLDMVKIFLQSSERVAKFGSIDVNAQVITNDRADYSFLQKLYTDILGRPISVSEAAAWSVAKKTYAEMTLMVIDSPEARAKGAPALGSSPDIPPGGQIPGASDGSVNTIDIWGWQIVENAAGSAGTGVVGIADNPLADVVFV